ncbi:MAG: hypothetical protein HPY68_04740 [Candidatus Atribacteria bacterium]|nr:hypothetical protein [Candidatus Atribacteria bacterium]
MAVHLLNDAWLNLFDWAVVASNDSDLAEALSLVKKRNKKILLIPTVSSTGKVRMKNPTAKLSQYADAIRFIHLSSLKKSQLPEVIPGTNLHRPPEWEQHWIPNFCFGIFPQLSFFKEPGTVFNVLVAGHRYMILQTFFTGVF